MANIPEQINTACDVRTCHDVIFKKKRSRETKREREGGRGGRGRGWRKNTQNENAIEITCYIEKSGYP